MGHRRTTVSDNDEVEEDRADGEGVEGSEGDGAELRAVAVQRRHQRENAEEQREGEVPDRGVASAPQVRDTPDVDHYASVAFAATRAPRRPGGRMWPRRPRPPT